MDNEIEKPQFRRLLGAFLIIFFIAAYALFVVSLIAPVMTFSPLLQLPIWTVLGIIWIFPVMPIVRWTETGSFTK